ncbi:MAG: FAD-dependent oxidoreductase, partial [Alphaproteobacteria bacterium]
PHIVRKLMEGRAQDIRECVGAAYCIDRLYSGGGALCIQNPAMGREKTMPHAITRSSGARRKVVVAGAGPGGLEAARVSAERGHRVVLFEASDKTGGQVNLAVRATWRGNLGGITRWLESQALKLGVEIRLEHEATAERVLAEEPDVVIVATGGRPNKGRFRDSDFIVSTWDILAGGVVPAESVLLYDDNGDHQGPSCAEYMAARGAKVELVTYEQQVAKHVGITNRPVHMRELYKGGVVMTPDMRMAGVEREGNKVVVVLKNDYTGEEEERLVDQVVVEHGTLPSDELYEALKPRSRNLGELDLDGFVLGRPRPITNKPAGRFVLYRVGDAVSSRNIHAAIYDSLRLCKEL